MGIGDWGLGIGPNPQSPIPKFKLSYLISNNLLYFTIIILNYKLTYLNRNNLNFLRNHLIF